MDGPAILAAVGDVLVDRADPAGALGPVAPLLLGADLAFGNFEGVLSDAHGAIPGASTSSIVSAANAVPLRAFDVLSLANNHAMDAGGGGLADTMDALARHGVQTIGAGPTVDAALRPYTVDIGGQRVAVLAATSVFQVGTGAGQQSPGVAPLRAEDSYLPPYPGVHAPGVPPRVLSILDERDWERLAGAVAAAAADADLVVVSVHWGDHTRPWVLTEHERLCGGLLVEAGADVVLGHHQHILRGAEFIDGSVVLYGLGHAVFDYPRFPAELRARGVDVTGLSEAELVDRFGEYGIFPRPDSPAFPFHPMARTTAVALVELTGAGLGRCGLVPCRIDPSGTPRPVRRDSPEWTDTVAFLRACPARARLASQVVDGGWVHGGYDVVELIGIPDPAEPAGTRPGGAGLVDIADREPVAQPAPGG
ncbi:MAG: hypothetical protein V7637_2319 [Mycobacteriales bacterium]|jgi:poly-gamma-glutamate synthesis protein (capsule biosynthesis protein)